ncbi:hypothetical protein FOL47_007072 [Perkinsus chesapeaki]|uniref:Cyclic nucleotide-binding domain-containing protein n=1 Tax=Perkinsus chesapeaki TaxID=330153 RepID=A0A7J6LMT8_PERCH|nr:hypothetical protein FOL47_007072 [Perkinsus chesapeaki]
MTIENDFLHSTQEDTAPFVGDESAGHGMSTTGISFYRPHSMSRSLTTGCENLKCGETLSVHVTVGDRREFPRHCTDTYDINESSFEDVSKFIKEHCMCPLPVSNEAKYQSCSMALRWGVGAEPCGTSWVQLDGGAAGKVCGLEAVYKAMYDAVSSLEFGFFERFSEVQVRDIVKVLQIRHYREGDVVCNKGEEGHEFYLVFRGEVDIYPEPKEPPVATFLAGDSFGELALMHDAPRAATVICRTDCTLGLLHRLPFMRATFQHKMLEESRIVDFLTSCVPFCGVPTRKLWRCIDAWFLKRSTPGKCLLHSRSPWAPIGSQLSGEGGYDGEVDMTSEFDWSEQSFEFGPADAPVPLIHARPEATPIPFFVVMRGKVMVHGTIAIHGRVATKWQNDGDESREEFSFGSFDTIDSEAVRVFENIPLFELSQGMFYGQGEMLLGPEVRQILPNVSVSNLSVVALTEGRTLSMDQPHFAALCHSEAEFFDGIMAITRSLSALEKQQMVQIVSLLDRPDFARKSAHYMLKIMSIVQNTGQLWASVPEFAEVAQRCAHERHRAALSEKVADKVEHANDEIRGYPPVDCAMDVLELLEVEEEPVVAGTEAVGQQGKDEGAKKRQTRKRRRRNSEGGGNEDKRMKNEGGLRKRKPVDRAIKARSMFLNNLPVEATSEWVKRTVLSVLPEGSNGMDVIDRVFIGRDKKYPTRCAGWANVTFTSESIAEDALARLDYHMVDCEDLLKEAEEKEQSASAGGAGQPPTNKREMGRGRGGHGPKGVRVTKRCLYASSGLQRHESGQNGEHTKSTASQFRLPEELVQKLKDLVREHSLSDSPAGRLADSYRRTFGERVPVQEYGFKNFVAVSWAS